MPAGASRLVEDVDAEGFGWEDVEGGPETALDANVEPDVLLAQSTQSNVRVTAFFHSL